MNNGDMPASISEYLYYDIDLKCLIWLKDKGTAKNGDIAGTNIGRGYKQVKFNGKSYLQHRIIFYLSYGYLPEYIDHIDGNTSNNSPSNLRAATHSQNMMNRKTQSNCKSGRVGVDYMKNDNRWRAQIHKDGKKIYLGVYKTIIDAVIVRIKAEEKYHGKFSRVS